MLSILDGVWQSWIKLGTSNASTSHSMQESQEPHAKCGTFFMQVTSCNELVHWKQSTTNLHSWDQWNYPATIADHFTPVLAKLGWLVRICLKWLLNLRTVIYDCHNMYCFRACILWLLFRTPHYIWVSQLLGQCKENS